MEMTRQNFQEQIGYRDLELTALLTRAEPRITDQPVNRNSNQPVNRNSNQQETRISDQPESRNSDQPENRISNQTANKISGQPENRISYQPDNRISNQPEATKIDSWLICMYFLFYWCHFKNFLSKKN